MYLPESFVRDLLIQDKMWQPGDTLYLSSGIGKTNRARRDQRIDRGEPD
jgi:hypothetical protein